MRQLKGNPAPTDEPDRQPRRLNVPAQGARLPGGGLPSGLFLHFFPLADSLPASRRFGHLHSVHLGGF